MKRFLGEVEIEFAPELAKKTTGHLEFEARFLPYDMKNTSQFNRLLTRYLKEYPHLRSEKSIENIAGDKRDDQGATIETIIGKNRKYHTKKQLLYRKGNQDEYGINFELSEEREIRKVPLINPTIRKKQRWSFPITDYAVLDFTIADTDGVTSQELELELTKKGGLNDFLKLIEVVFLEFHDTVTPYTREESELVFSTINGVLGDKSPNKFRLNGDHVFQLRDLQYEDLTGSGLNSDRYRMAYKTDGTRRLLFVNGGGFWLVMGENINRVVALAGDSRDRVIYLFDGELLQKGEVKNLQERYLYVVYDGLYLGSEDIRSEPHTQRLDHFDDFFENPKLKNFIRPFLQLVKVEKKEFHEFISGSQSSGPQDRESLFEITKQLQKERKNKPYDTDGYVFIPEEMPYNSGIDKCAPRDRRWINAPDMVKWKDPHNITIDFLIEAQGDVFGLHLGSIKEKARFTIDGGDLRLVSGAIGEFEFLNGRPRLRKIRTDKKVPNSVAVGEGLLKLLEDPIAIETLSGDNLRLVRKYHNRVKRAYFAADQGKTILDLGSGPGGDYDKMSHYSKIVFVEPSLENINQMRLRIKEPFEVVNSMRQIDAINLQHRLLVVHSPAESSDLVTAATKKFIGLVDTVSMQFSLTFFWKSQSLLRSLKETITSNLKPGGSFIFATLDGSALGHSGIIQNEHLETTSYRIRYTGTKIGDPVTITLKDSVTVHEDQIEYPVNLADLTDILNPVQFEILDGERFLPPEAAFLSRLYLAGRMTRKEVVETPILSPHSQAELDALLEDMDRPPREVRRRLEFEEPKIPHFIPLVTLTSDPDPVKRITNRLARIGAQNGDYYHALLLSFSPEYVQAGSAIREVLVDKLARELYRVDYGKNEEDLSISIWVVEDNQLIYKSKSSYSHQIILLKIPYNGKDYYEVIGEQQPMTGYYKTAFKSINPIIVALKAIKEDKKKEQDKKDKKGTVEVTDIQADPVSYQFKFKEGRDQREVAITDPDLWIFPAKKIDRQGYEITQLAELIKEDRPLTEITDQSLPEPLAVGWIKTTSDNELEANLQIIDKLAKVIPVLAENSSLLIEFPDLKSYSSVSLVYLLKIVFKEVQAIKLGGIIIIHARDFIEGGKDKAIRAILNRSVGKKKLSLVPISYLNENLPFIESLTKL